MSLARMSLARHAWGVAATAAGPLLPLWLARRVAAGKEFAARLSERSGIGGLPRPPGRLVWLHGASVGEAVSVVPLARALVAARPDLQVLLTSGTATSARAIAAHLGGPAAMPEQSGALPGAPWARHQFVPLDRPAWVAAFLDHWRPDLALFVESEFWPNLLRAVAARDIPAALVNARLSARSARRWALVPGMARGLLGGFRVVLAQSHVDAARLMRLGARGVALPGNLKAAAPPLPADPAELARLRALIGGRPAWVMASTHDGDEILAAGVHARVAATHPALLTILVPRHPERGAGLAAALGDAPRRAAGGNPDGPIWLADTLGELGLMFRLAPVVAMGKSFIPPGGGQNPLEPARLGAAIAFGPHMHNFTDIAARLVAADAACQVADAAGLAGFVTRMLNEPAELARMGQAAATVAAQEAAGVLDRVLDALGPLLPPPA
jgi:3-deoxy-D-manno-octulosonic-acid transferase